MARSDRYEAFPSLRLYDQLGCPYTVFGNKWDGPIWNGHCMMLTTSDSFGDAAFFHELVHWMLASPAQRRMPDFALGRQVNASESLFISSTSDHLYDADAETFPGDFTWGEKKVSIDRVRYQEWHACDALVVYEPLVGLTSWDEPIGFMNVNDAAHDFGGFQRVNDKRVWNAVYRHVVSVFDPTVTIEQMYAYLEGVKDDRE